MAQQMKRPDILGVLWPAQLLKIALNTGYTDYFVLAIGVDSCCHLRITNAWDFRRVDQIFVGVAAIFRKGGRGLQKIHLCLSFHVAAVSFSLRNLQALNRHCILQKITSIFHDIEDIFHNFKASQKQQEEKSDSCDPQFLREIVLEAMLVERYFQEQERKKKEIMDSLGVE